MLPTPYIKCDYDTVYEPSEDSFLLLDTLEEELPYLESRFKNRLSVVCELGPGSGIVTTFLMQNGIPSKNQSIYFAADISPWALDATLDAAKRNKCEKSYLEPIQSDLNRCIKSKEVDLLIFNPPYVPAEEVPAVPTTKEERDEWLDLALLGGTDGMVVTNKVLDQLDIILSPTGVAYILFCARNKPEQIVERMSRDGWSMELIMHRKAGWEVLSVYRFTR
ncbi:hypothetical protein HG535_0G03940 [Zygotorulaspora mrakii]|uniref:Methyltransferase small domain-containing protein n=1 Tax=Zygotorulaspora mrakii TaxID=42260 RepID=A0A7H9B735_ZYGMR|nr:uncharacterized protein HG535_0G03940 [Zygotorulaspora mrakii]QLG74511.1 hypothetical protein HG535_0G03940 [Zygotorulaspora mrakii]